MATESVGNASISKVPDWLQAELFIDVLKDTVKGFSKIKSFKAESGSAAGENYATIMLRVNIQVELEDGSDKTISFMLKLPHQSEIYQKMLEKNNIFELEYSMYKTYVPELEQMYRNAGVDVKFSATAYELKGAKTDYILLEDLSPRGFKNTNRLEGLDKDHTEAALHKLAQWHAASVVRVATKGAYPETFNNGFFKEENREMLDEMNKGLAQNFIKCCVKFEGHEEYFEEVKAVEHKVTDSCLKMATPDPTGLNVLNHGDFWSNNMMFSHDETGKVKETILVDYQVPKYGSVAQDLLYFLMSSTRLEDKLSKFDYYIKFYHDSLVKHLKILNYTEAIPTLREIHTSLFKYGFWGYLTVTGVMAAVLVDPTENASFDNFLSDTEEAKDFKTLMYTNPRYVKHIRAILPWLLNRGALEAF